MIAALVNEGYIGVWSFPQLRFCPMGYNDTLPFASTGPSMLAGSWNQTLWVIFGNQSNVAYATSCLYPCFNTAWSLKDTGELLAIPRYKTEPTNTMAAWIANIVVYKLITTSGLCTLTVFFMQFFGYTPVQILQPDVRGVLRILSYLRWSTIQILVRLPVHFVHWSSKGETTRIPKTGSNSRGTKIISICFKIGLLYLKVIDIYARVMSPISFMLFIAWIEWCITTDIEGETFRHIGQWGAVVAAAFALLAAMITRYGNIWARQIKHKVKRARLYEATKVGGKIAEQPPALDTDGLELLKLATCHIKKAEVLTATPRPPGSTANMTRIRLFRILTLDRILTKGKLFLIIIQSK